MRRLSFVALLCVVVGLAGCGGGYSAPAPAAPVVPPTGGPFVYVTDGGVLILQVLQSQNGVLSASAQTSGPNTGLNGASGIVRDAAGNIYVAEYVNSSNGVVSQVSVFPPALAGNVTPKSTIAGSLTGLSGPYGIALDAQGHILVANTTANSVTIYNSGLNGNVAPAATISGTATGLNTPTGIALDTAQNIYVSNQSGSITVFPAGASGNVAPIRTISGTATNLNVPAGITLDASNNLYVANANGNSVTEYAAGVTGNVSPMATIAGSSTLLSVPQNLVIGSGNKLFVTNFGTPGFPGTVTVYAQGATGNVAPVQTITGFAGPIGISL